MLAVQTPLRVRLKPGCEAVLGAISLSLAFLLALGAVSQADPGTRAPAQSRVDSPPAGGGVRGMSLQERWMDTHAMTRETAGAIAL